MPFVLYLLGLAVFAQGMSEFMLSGLIPDIARDLRVSIPAAGSLTSAFAVGMVVGAPLMALLGRRLPRRRALLVLLTVFLLTHVVGAVTTSYPVLLLTRVIAALANAGFLAVALSTVAVLAPPGARGRATAVLLGGITLSCVAGVPGGALLGQVWGWRSAFWAVALLSVPALIAIVARLPRDSGETAARTGVRAELRALRAPGALVPLALGALVNGATFGTFTYLAPLVTEVTGLGAGWVPGVLALFGLGAFLGATAGGRIADRHRPERPLLAAGALLLAGWTLLAVAAPSPVAAVVLVLVQGTLSFAVGSALISRVLYAAAGAPTLAGATATSALNVGAALGPWLGGAAIGAGFGHRSPVAVSAVLTALALALALAALARGRTRAPRRAPRQAAPAGAGAAGERPDAPAAGRSER
ncbi:Cmx/CmrA family chloramphenicol efflux MFS transporter [Streptomyces clavuligerus]|uniref:Cmx/CmrA family chloramphenicol efflux MFS transporter n=4 Tax=Streptomyces clavuligerus TaxID=1901 RepID=UPI0018D0D86A|nr:Cmx/CmrA family chloramphenicol efflux MFS transporter [Streptomyces clavuligerus]